MASNAQFKERLAFSAVGAWVPMAAYNRVGAVGLMDAADSTEGVTVQLRKATDAAGANAADLGTAVTVRSTATNTDVSAVAEATVDDLGAVGGVQFTHVSASITKASGSPAPGEAVYGVVYRGGARFSS